MDLSFVLFSKHNEKATYMLVMGVRLIKLRIDLHGGFDVMGQSFAFILEYSPGKCFLQSTQLSLKLPSIVS